MEAWAEGGGYKVTVYREAKGAAGYRKIKEYGEESGKRARILWMKKRVYGVMWDKEGEVGGSAAREEGDDEYGSGAPARTILVASHRGQGVMSNDSMPSMCGAGSVESAEGNDSEQQRKAAWAWKRPQDAVEEARERTWDGMVWSPLTGRMSTPYGQ